MAAPADRRRISPTLLGAGVLGGVLFRLAQPGIGVWPLAFVALVPVLVVARSPRRGALAGVVAGGVGYLWLLTWVFRFAWFAWVLLGAWMACGFACTGAVAGLTWRRPVWLRIVTIASAWCVAEFVLGHWPFGGFAWGQLGVTQYAVGGTRSVAAVGGVAAISWLLAAANVAVATLVDAVVRRAAPGADVVTSAPHDVSDPAPRHAVGTAAAALGAVALVFGIAWVGRPESAPVGRLHVGVVQANTFEDGDVDTTQMVSAHLDATRTLPPGLDLVVWGESSLVRAEIDPALAQYVMTASDGVPVLANAYVVRGDTAFANTNVLFRPATARGVPPWTYVKAHRVPFGEYVPFRPLLAPVIPQLARIPRDAVVGGGRGIFTIAGRPLGTMICFESAFSEPAAARVRNGAEALIVTTNNSSYGRSDLSRQYLATTAMRAVEQHRALVVAAISGRSAVIAPDGTIGASTPLWEARTLSTGLALQTDRTLFGRTGDLVTPISALLLAGGLLLTLSGGRAGNAAGIASEGVDLRNSGNASSDRDDAVDAASPPTAQPPRLGPSAPQEEA